MRPGTDRSLEALLAGCDPLQREAITCDETPLCIVAGAGAGKTRVLTRRIAWRIATGSAVASRVLAVTFTRKAGGELRGRLARLGVPGLAGAGTIHSIALSELQRLSRENGRRPPAVLEDKARLLAAVLGGGDREGLREVATEIGWAKANLVLPARYEQAAGGGGRRPRLIAPAALADAYDAYEVLRRRRGLVDFDDLLVDCARAVREDPDFGSTARWRFRHLFVDEFQDVSRAQLALIEAWLARGRDDEPDPDICVVGDPDQAIYSWNGADPQIMTTISSRWHGGRTIELEANHKSTPQVVRLAGSVLPGRPVGTERPTTRADGPVPTLSMHFDDLAEANEVAAGLKLAHGRGHRWSELAVLARTNAQLELVGAALAAAGVPFEVTSASFERLGDGRQDAPRAPIERTGAAGGRPRRRADTVQLATFHKAKGLEWPVVFVTGLEQGLVPIAHAATEAELAEERRLLYVALTRAGEALHLSHARHRMVAGRVVERRPSPWLESIEAVRRTLTGAGGSRRSAALEAISACRAQLAAISDC